MAGRCFQCAEPFGFFKREYDCGNCGKIFCAKCTPHSVVIPNKGKKAVRVCNDCHAILNSQKQCPSQACETTQSGGPNLRQNAQQTQQASTAMPVKDDTDVFDPDEDIQRRLKKLKEPENPTSKTDINSKFENLTGRAPSSAKPSDVSE